MVETKSEVDVLLEKVEARQGILKAVIESIPHIVSERGKRKSYEEKKYHTQIATELDNFLDFSFYTYGALTEFGGENLKVWYHPKGKKQPGNTPVLDIYWWDGVKDCQVTRFDPAPEWQRKLLAIAKDRQAALQKAARQQKKEDIKQAHIAAAEAKTAEEAARRRKLLADLPKEAKRLGL